MLAQTAPTDQRAGVRPISFVLDNMGSLGDPIMLPVRPEDLTRTEPARATVHQTLGLEETGWVDHFGKGLPVINISGTTGWRYTPASGRDGFQSFEALNELVAHRYPQFRQDAIDAGRDPSGVKLIFADLLDNFAYSVVPTQFVLRRSKSRPLLFQYNIALQVVAARIDSPLITLPEFGSVFGGLSALGGVMGQFARFAGQVDGWVASALGFVDRALSPIAGTVRAFVGLTNNVLGQINTVVRGANNVINGTANRLIGIAADLARVGVNVFRTFNNIVGLPANLRANLAQVASAYNEVLCIFSNALRPRQTYEQFDGLYGASNCSSTTGGRAQSRYVGQNVFELMLPPPGPVNLSSVAMSSGASLSRMDPVLAPMPMAEVGRHLGNVVAGVAL